VSETVETVIDRALVALDALALLGEDVEDEWTYVTDIVAAQRSRLESIAAERSVEQVPPERAAAIDLAIAETAAIADPHRAIDWLSTYPDIVALALDEPVGGGRSGGVRGSGG
jgi:hypothetical protein